MATKPGSLRFYADLYGVSHEALRSLKNEGIDLADEQAVKDRLALTGGAIDFVRTPSLPVSGEGLGAAIRRLQAAEQSLHADYEAARLANSPKEGTLLKQWRETIEQLRKAEDSNPSIEKEKANTVSKDDLARVLGALFGNLRLDLESFGRRVSAELEGKRSRFDIEAIISRETSRIVENLSQCGYLEGAENE